MIKFEGCFSFPFICVYENDGFFRSEVCWGGFVCLDHGVHLEGSADVIPKSSSSSQFPQGNLTLRVGKNSLNLGRINLED